MSEARTRLLNTATRLFYTEGLHAVGIDRIVAEAGVTRATLYRHFPSKDDLLVAYLKASDEAIKGQVEHARSKEGSASDVVRAVGETITEGIRSNGFRGCAFLNAAAEYPAVEHPVHQTVVNHRQWFLETVTELLADIGETAPGPAARHFVMLRDGAMVAGCLTPDPERVCETFRIGVEGILKYRETADVRGGPVLSQTARA